MATATTETQAIMATITTMARHQGQTIKIWVVTALLITMEEVRQTRAIRTNTIIMRTSLTMGTTSQRSQEEVMVPYLEGSS